MSTHDNSVSLPHEDFHTLDKALREDEKTLVLIDGANCYATLRGLGFQLDWRKFYFLMHRKTNVVSLNYYTAINQEEDGTIALKKLLDFIEYNGYNMITKMAKRIKLEDDSFRIKGNMDIEIVLDAIQAAPNVDHIIFVTGDGDFAAAISYIQRMGKKASVISSYYAKQSSVSDDLRRAATHFIDIASFKDEVQLERRTEEASE